MPPSWLLAFDGRLGTVNRFTGALTKVADINGGSLFGAVAWHPDDQVFYIVEGTSLRSFDPATLIQTTIGSGVPYSEALDVDPDGVLWGFSGDTIYTVDTANGTSAPVGPKLALYPNACSFSPELGTFYVVRDTLGDELYEVDPYTGQSTKVMNVGSGTGFEIISTPSRGSFERRGTGCNDSSGKPVRLLLRGEPDINRSFTADVLQGANKPYLLCVGASSTSWGGVPLPYDLGSLGAQAGCNIYVSLDVVMGTFPAGSQLTVNVPYDVRLTGIDTFWQVLLVDTDLPGLGIAASDMVVLNLGQ